MYKLLLRLFRYLLPIVRQAAVQAAADELSQQAYGRTNRRPYYTPYNRRPRTYGSRDYSHLGFRPRPEFRESDPSHFSHEGRDFHDVLLVAFDLSGPSAENAEAWLKDNLPDVGVAGDKGEIYLDSWWIANDERFDRSDTDSAVFVSKGNQEKARALLREHGLVG